MPVFTFEKIAPPVGGPAASATSVSSVASSSVANGSVPSIAKRQRGVIVQILDRFVDTRVRRTLSEENGVSVRDLPKSQG